MCECVTPEFFTERRVTARKPHRCEECRRPIVPGELYVKASGKWDGNLDSFGFCLFCRELARQADARHEGVLGGDCIAFGELREALNEHLQDEGAPRSDFVLLNQLFGYPDDDGLEPEDDEPHTTKEADG